MWKVQKAMKATKANIETVRKAIEAINARSAWDRGVKAYALDILSEFDEWREFSESQGVEAPELNERTALNGAKDWHQWAEGGCGLVYNYAIAERLYTPARVARLPKGFDYLAEETRAVKRAWRLISRTIEHGAPLLFDWAIYTGVYECHRMLRTIYASNIAEAKRKAQELREALGGEWLRGRLVVKAY